MNYLKEIEKEIKGKTFIEQMMVVKKYVVFDSPNNKGVYQIENFYIGKSNNILSRITHHIKEVLKAEDSKVIFNKKKLYLIKTALENKKLHVKHLDKDIKKEKLYIEKLYPTLPLMNIEFVTDKMLLNKHKEVIKYLKYKKFSYVADKFTSKYHVSKVTVDNIIILEIAPTYELAKKRLKEYLTTKITVKKSRAEKRSKNKSKKVTKDLRM